MEFACVLAVFALFVRQLLTCLHGAQTCMELCVLYRRARSVRASGVYVPQRRLQKIHGCLDVSRYVYCVVLQMLTCLHGACGRVSGLFACFSLCPLCL